LNLGPTDYESAALTAELLPRELKLSTCISKKKPFPQVRKGNSISRAKEPLAFYKKLSLPSTRRSVLVIHYVKRSLPMNVLSTIKSYGQNAIDFVLETGTSAYTAIKPHYIATMSKINHIWIDSQPFRDALWEFLQTKIGAAIGLIALSVIPFTAASAVNNSVAKVIFMTGGVFALIGGAYLLSGLPIPFFPEIASGLV
jgi:hypothetical protein